MKSRRELGCNLAGAAGDRGYGAARVPARAARTVRPKGTHHGEPAYGDSSGKRRRGAAREAPVAARELGSAGGGNAQAALLPDGTSGFLLFGLGGKMGSFGVLLVGKPKGVAGVGWTRASCRLHCSSGKRGGWR